jgi:thymidylate kinase
MPKFIILEGTDSTGKSSLTKFLAKKLNAFYFHSSGHKSLHVGMQAHHQQILDAVEVNLDNGHNVVLDRHWPSQQVYGATLRPGVGIYDITRLRDHAHALGVTYVFCNKPNWGRYVETHKDHDHDVFHQLTSDQFNLIGLRYEMLFTDIDHVKYSIEEHGHDLNTFSERFT